MGMFFTLLIIMLATTGTMVYVLDRIEERKQYEKEIEMIQAYKKMKEGA